MASRKEPAPLRPTNIKSIGDIAWGTHCCLFYETAEELIQTLAAFFQAGIEANEYCLWITSGVVSEQNARKALADASVLADAAIRQGQIEIRSTAAGYGDMESFDPEAAIRTWIEHSEHALALGYEGFRLAGDPFIPSRMNSWRFIDYESSFDRVIHHYPIIAFCVYPEAECSPSDIAHLTSRHEYVLAPGKNGLELIENAGRKEAEAALKDSREIFRSIVEHNPDAIFIIAPDGSIRFANPAGQKLLGEPLRRLKGELFRIPYAPGDRIETELVPAHRTITAEVTAATTEWDSLKASLVTVRDISERKTAQLLLEKQQQELAAIYENTPTPMLLVDSELKVRKANAAALETIGRQEPDIQALSSGEALGCTQTSEAADGCGSGPLCKACVIYNTVIDTLRTGLSHKALETPIRRLTQEGAGDFHYLLSTVPVDLGVRLVLVSLEDVTELKKTLEDLQEKEARLRSIFQAAPVGIGTLRPYVEKEKIVKRVITEANNRLCRMLGYQACEIIGLEAAALYETLEDYERIGTELYAQMDVTGIGEAESHWKRKDGSVIDVHLSAAPFDPLDWEKGLSFVIMDITQLRQAYAEQQKLESQLRQSQKMEAIGQLTGGIAHDFNNLLQIINGYSDMIREDLPRGHNARPSLDEVLTAGTRAAELIRQLLAFSRQQVMNMQTLYLNDLLTKLSKMIHRIIGEHIEFEFIPGRSLGLVRADSGQIEQVIINLCINARDAMPEGGRLMIETSNVFINGEYCGTHLEAEPGRYVLLCITDSGVGMDEATQARIFDPFFTTKAVGQGTGLGLSTAYGIVRQHGGIINVYSEPGRGSLFKIYLPVAERLALEVGREIPRKSRGGHETILVAEDDRMVRELMKTILERAGYTIYTAINGEEAINAVKARKEEIDMAILDVVMPRQSGKAVFNQIRKIKPAMTVLFASGYSENAIHTDFILDAGMELLQKPFASGDLLNRVRQLLDKDR